MTIKVEMVEIETNVWGLICQRSELLDLLAKSVK